MGAFTGRLLAVLGVLGALVLVLAAAGLLPAAEPPPPRVETFAPDKAVLKPSRVLEQSEQPQAGATLPPLRLLPLCEAPAQGARWFKLALSASQEGLLVWCKQGYELFVADDRAGELALTRAARFTARGELAGGAAAGDFDGDGQRDLVLGVAARKGVAHRSGAGVFWLRGRREGGFEPARILAEISTLAIAAHARGPGRADELVVLTAGDVAAQRPAELWLFAREPSLSRKQVLPVGLDPRGLALRAGAGEGRLDAFVLSGQPGRLTRVAIELATLAPLAQPESLELRGAQALAHEPSFDEALFARDASALYRVARGAPLALEPFARDAQVGPFALADLDADLKADLLAAIETGVEWFAAGGSSRSELGLPEELRLLDVETLRPSAALVAPLALVTERAQAKSLSLLVLPKPPWPAAGATGVTLARGELAPEQGLAELALE